MDWPLLISILILLITDLSWILTNKSMYDSLVVNIQIVPMRINMPAALLAYILMIIGFIFIIVPMLNKNSPNKVTQAVTKGGLFGFLVYGIFNATNYAMFQNYSLKVAIIDTLWGTFIYSFITFLYLKL